MQHINYLHRLRKQTSVTQTDISHLLGGTDRSIISKIEKGIRPVSPVTAITYYLLFDKSMLKQIQDVKEVQNIKEQLKARLTRLIVDLEELKKHPEIQARIDFFDKVLNDLIQDEELCTS